MGLISRKNWIMFAGSMLAAILTAYGAVDVMQQDYYDICYLIMNILGFITALIIFVSVVKKKDFPAVTGILFILAMGVVFADVSWQCLDGEDAPWWSVFIFGLPSGIGIIAGIGIIRIMKNSRRWHMVCFIYISAVLWLVWAMLDIDSIGVFVLHIPVINQLRRKIQEQAIQ